MESHAVLRHWSRRRHNLNILQRPYLDLNCRYLSIQHIGLLPIVWTPCR